MPCVSPRRAGRCNKQTEHDERVEKEDCVMPICAEVAPKRPSPDEIKEATTPRGNAAPYCLATEIFDHVVPADKTIIRIRHASWDPLSSRSILPDRRSHPARPWELLPTRYFESRELTHKAAKCNFMGRDWIVTSKVKHQTFGDDGLSLRSRLQPNAFTKRQKALIFSRLYDSSLRPSTNARCILTIPSKPSSAAYVNRRTIASSGTGSRFSNH